MDAARVELRPVLLDDFWLFERRAVDPGAGGTFNWSGYKNAEQRALEKVGFVREGVLRSTQFREGAWRDIVLYSLLRDEHWPG